jgi:predicted CXXCH cytochrome family protein
MTRLKLFILSGVMLIVAGFSLLALDMKPATAQDEPPDYVGASECADCHRDVARQHDDTLHALTLQDDSDAILADFEAGEEARMTLFPGEETPRPFTEDDVAYVVGTGQNIQAYLFEVERRDLRVLPAEWDVQAGEWRPLALADSWDDPAYDWEQNCAYCHVTGFDLERGRWEDDGVQCESCHGPGEPHVDAARDAGRNPNDEELIEIRAAINPGTDSQTCGQCHSRGVGADNLPYPLGYLPGEELTDSFRLITVSDEGYWWPSGHARHKYMQYNEWMSSAHAQNEIDCVDCHDPHTEEAFPAQLIAEPYAQCISCHNATPANDLPPNPVQEMWEGLPVVDQVIAEPGVHYLAEDGPSCHTCHAVTVPVDEGGERVSHALGPITPSVVIDEPLLQDSCTHCHTEVPSPALMQELIDDIQANTQTRIDMARAAITDNTPAWVVTALDFVERDGSLGIHNYAYSDALLDAVYEALNLYAAQ